MTEHTPTPWAYRPREHDDWGWLRGPSGELAAVAKGAADSDWDAHRRADTDPYGPNAAFIVKAVNNFDALVKALGDALAYIDLHQEVCQFDPPEITAARSLAGQARGRS